MRSIVLNITQLISEFGGVGIINAPLHKRLEENNYQRIF